MPSPRKGQKVEMKGDYVKGERLFKTLCAGCHAASSLQGIYGKPIASGGMNYTNNLTNKATEKWTYNNLDRWLKDPKQFAPETAMGVAGVKSSKDRRDLIEFMKLPTD